MTGKILKLQIEVQTILSGKQCWYVCDGAIGAAFQLALGRKVRRREPLQNRRLAKAYRDFEGEANLLVWCAWRLDSATRVISSSQADSSSCHRALSRLKGERILSAHASQPAWDLEMIFSNRLRLTLFCDIVPGDDGQSSNYYLTMPDWAFYAGPGQSYRVERFDK